jgi:arylsulfatase A-like enzyme
MGLDQYGARGRHPNPPCTPNLDEPLCAGVAFGQVWSNPTCTPSRSALLTGRHASRTGMGRWLPESGDPWDLQQSELTIAEMLKQSEHGYATAAVGKWHLASLQRDEPGLHPLQQGFDTHRGPLGNPTHAVEQTEERTNYRSWEKNIDGELSWSHRHITVDSTEEAMELVQTLPEPWFIYLA